MAVLVPMNGDALWWEKEQEIMGDGGLPACSNAMVEGQNALSIRMTGRTGYDMRDVH